MTDATTSTKRPLIDARTLISDDMRATLVSNMCDKFPQVTEEKADRGVGQMLAFLAACDYSDRPLSPSPLVDDFWHAFLLHTKAYREFCETNFGRFVDHQPGYLDPEEHGGGKALRARTVDSITLAGYEIDMEFWPELDLAHCSQCHANCSDSPNHPPARS
ncbi:glycine-rich domain-containing protein [Streptomyces sp. CA-106110]|uniref:glycine-rich domain-containing protein n=1 Tax=Streptomyces sp. CA-106110 TaxID=3240044 RepID=UPI003D92B2CC